MGRFSIRIILAAVASLALVTGAPVRANPPELLERGALRVCADGNNLPFSNRAGEGFENRIAEMMAEELGLPLTYTWAPQVTGFVRNTLELRVCDVIMGVAAGYGLVQNTNAYYRSTYAIVVPSETKFAPAGLSDSGFRGRTVGVVHGTPATLPLRTAGAQIQLYQVNVDTRVIHPTRDAVNDVARGVTEAAVLWGPIAGYYASRHDPPLNVIPIGVGRPAADGSRLDYRITMGVRRNEPLWKDWINDFIARRQDEINLILNEYGVPLLDDRGELIHVASTPRR